MGCLKICKSPLMDGYIPSDALKFIRVHEWTGAYNGCLAIC